MPARELTHEIGAWAQAEGGAIAAALKEAVDAAVAAKEKAEAAEASLKARQEERLHAERMAAMRNEQVRPCSFSLAGFGLGLVSWSWLCSCLRSCCFWSLCRFFTFACSGSAHGQRSLCPQRERERKGVESELERLVQSWSARKELRQMLATLPTIWPAAAVEVFPAALTQRYAWPEPKIKKKYMAALRYAEQQPPLCSRVS